MNPVDQASGRMEPADLLCVISVVVAFATFILGNWFSRLRESKQLQDAKTNKPLTARNEFAAGDTYNNNNNNTQRRSQQTNRHTDPWNPSEPSTSDSTRPYDNYGHSRPNKSSPASQYAHASSCSNAANDQASAEQPASQRDLFAPNGPQLLIERQHEPESNPSIPNATGSNPSYVNWINETLALIFSHSQSQRYSTIFSESLVSALNEKLNCITNSSPDHCDLIVELSGVKRELTTRPLLDDIRADSEQAERATMNLLFSCYFDRLVMDLVIQRAPMAVSSLSEPLASHAELASAKSYYELALENLDGRLKSMVSLNSKLIITEFVERPDFKISLSSIDQQQTGNVGASGYISEDTLVAMLVQAISQVIIVYYYGDDPEFPHYKQQTSRYLNKLSQIRDGANEIGRQLKQKISSKERKALIKIIRANNINYNQNVTCLMELDHSHHVQLTSTKSGSNPFWDEHFMFNLGDKSNELTIELWDSLARPEVADVGSSSGRKSLALAAVVTGAASKGSKLVKSNLVQGAKFLGSAKLSVEQMRQNPMQKVSLQLMSAACESGFGALVQTDPRRQHVDFGPSVAAGELLVELTFIEHSNSSQVQRSPSANSLTGAGLQTAEPIPVERKITPAGYTITTSTVAKAQTAPSDHSALIRPYSPVSQVSSLSTQVDTFNHSDLSSQRPATGDSGATGTGTGIGIGTGTEDGERATPHRSRSRSRSILRAIKRRFSFSHKRSRSASGSVSRAQTETPDGADASRVGSRCSESSFDLHRYGAKSMPSSREPSEVPTIVINRSALDGADALSFNQAKSQLVFECVELVPKAPETPETLGTLETPAPMLDAREPASLATPKTLAKDDQDCEQVTKYYAISDDALARKWRKKGTKLHLFNEHQFVACHLSGSPTCHNCGRVFSRRPGKQGYKCRNCHLLSHKECHVKVDHQCPYAPKEGLKLEHTSEQPPKSSRLTRSNSLKLASWTQRNRQSPLLSKSGPQSNSNPRLSSKSISLEVDDR